MDKITVVLTLNKKLIFNPISSFNEKNIFRGNNYSKFKVCYLEFWTIKNNLIFPELSF